MTTTGWLALGCFAAASIIGLVATLIALRMAALYRKAAFEERDIRLSLERAIGNGGDWLWPKGEGDTQDVPRTTLYPTD